MEISSYDDKKALPKGIVMEVSDGGHWHGNRWIKTGDATWARVHGTNVVGDEELRQMVAEGRNNISPCPSEPLTFPEAYADWNINILAGGTIRAAHAMEVLRKRKAVLDQRSANALRALQGIEEEA